MDKMKMRLLTAANTLHQASEDLHEAIVLCDYREPCDVEQIVKDALELTVQATPTSNLFGSANKSDKAR